VICATQERLKLPGSTEVEAWSWNIRNISLGSCCTSAKRRATVGHAVCSLSIPGHVDLARISLASGGFSRSNQVFVVRQNITCEVECDCKATWERYVSEHRLVCCDSRVPWLTNEKSMVLGCKGSKLLSIGSRWSPNKYIIRRCHIEWGCVVRGIRQGSWLCGDGKSCCRATERHFIPTLTHQAA
jgi:hypothetical protein